jgi:hypothetical protein
MLFTEYMKRVWFFRYCPATQRKRVRIKRVPSTHMGDCVRTGPVVTCKVYAGALCKHTTNVGYTIARLWLHGQSCVRMSACVPSRDAQHQTQRCLLKCDAQQRVGAIVVARFRVYACAPNKTLCSENKGSGEPDDHRGGNRASLAVTACVARSLSNPRALRTVLIHIAHLCCFFHTNTMC